jgi:hypothetical protein
MASSSALAFRAHVMSGGSAMAPPHEPLNKHKTGRFCVKVSTNILDSRGQSRYSFKGYGPDESEIKAKTTAARDKRCRPEDRVTEPLVTTLPICDECDDRIEVFDVSQDFHYHLM